MANKKHLKILREGVAAWNAWRDENPEKRPDLNRANLREANLRGADLSRALLNRAILRGAHLRGADLSRANLRGANLRGANLRNVNLRSADLEGAELESADLIQANLLGASLEGANLISATLRDATLISAKLLGAKLNGANLSSASISDADLSYADLEGAELEGAELRRANLNHADLSDANFALANLATTLFGAVDLRQAKGLEEANHHTPSTIGADTLTKSQGKIPDIFLKGCGLNDWQIAAAKLENANLTSEQVTDLTYEIDRLRGESPIQISPIFISYSRTDSDFADALEPRLDRNRIRYWRDVHDMVAGPIEEQVERAIELNRIMLLVLSKDSIESDWVESEVIRARELAKERREHVLCPIAIDDSWKTCNWERRLRIQVEKYNILDFSKWEDSDELDKAFRKLFEGLGIFYPKPA